ncbi:Multidrug resistance protein MdtC [Sinobacterium norvegicum]|uniref:Multidrug resistance protein MdtC n=1 Tax=Sinobacterium norvegicum TaxID=1641715 RepID=A0ABN8EQ09_9GAMM|nr:efflux RND transporter permease subunit [Sinobacterium norvegicum]CAH0992351.1 Multidrug resistance protein MdtC [Sinobacterium norvegicum]
MKQLIGFFARRPLLVNLILALIFMVGYITLSNQEYSSYPSMDLGKFTVSTSRPGASAEDIELSVTVPLEEEILEISGLEKLISSSMEGSSSLLVEANPDNNRSQNAVFEQDLQKAVDRAAARLPDDLPYKPLVTRHDPDRIPIMELLLHGDVSEEVLRQSSRKIVNQLRLVPGVSAINKEGFRRKEVKILLDPQRLHQLGVSYDEVISAITARNVRDSGGSISSFQSERDIITVGEFKDPKELAEVIIRVGEPGNYLRVRDIADVVIDYEDWSIQSYSNGRPGISMQVIKGADADELEAANNLRAFVERVQPTLPLGVTLEAFNDNTRFTRNMMNMLVDNALAGIVLVFAVLLAFFPFRFTIWVVVGIPTAILMAFIFMPMLGMSINQTSIGALILMLGILVDDAIVIAESIFQRSEQGDSPIDAAINGTHEIAAPVLTSSATTLLAFAPLLFLSGTEGKFMWVVPAMVMMVLVASLIECKLMLPAHMAHALSKNAEDGKGQERTWFKPIEVFYQKWLRVFIYNRYRALAIMTVGSIVIGYISANNLRMNLYPSGDIDNIIIKAEMPVGTPFEQTQLAMQGLDQRVRAMIEQHDLLNIKYTIGHHDGRAQDVTSGQQPSWGLMNIFLVPLGERQLDANELMQTLRSELSDSAPFIKLVVEASLNTPPTGRAVEVDIVGNHEQRYFVAEAISEYLHQQPGAAEVWSSYSPGKDLIELVLNHEAMADYGLTVQQVSRAVRIAFNGLLIDELQTVDERIKFRLQFKQPEQGKAETLYGLSIINNQGQPIMLRNVAELVSRPGESSIRHDFGDRTITVYADVHKDKISVAEINKNVAEFITRTELRQRYPELEIRQGGESVRQQAAMGDVGNAATLAFAGILFLLVLLFNSISQPLLVMSVIPLGIVGVLLAFAVQGFEMSLSAMVGMTGLAGILVNDSLIMIDKLNKQRVDGAFLSQMQIIDAASSRLRPIYITTLTTVAGLFPTAYGLLGDNPFLRPMVAAMFWGVLFGSLITLFYLPCLYAVEQDARVGLRRLKTRLRQRLAI